MAVATTGFIADGRDLVRVSHPVTVWSSKRFFLREQELQGVFQKLLFNVTIITKTVLVHE